MFDSFIDKIFKKRMELKELNKVMIKSGFVPDLDFLDNPCDIYTLSYNKIINSYDNDENDLFYYFLKGVKIKYKITLHFAYLNKKYCKVDKIFIE